MMEIGVELKILMTSSQISYSQLQISAWFRGLLSIALADNDFSDKEKQLIEDINQSHQLGGETDLTRLEPISPAELAESLGTDPNVAQNFLRTAVMMAMVDGNYSATEDELIQQFCVALGQEIKPMTELRAKLQSLPHYEEHHSPLEPVFEPVKEWLDHLEVHDQRLAKFLCKMIPAQCPFERDVYLFGRKIMHIPAMCQINPLYDQLVGLRFRSLSYLADECGEDVSEYC